MMSSPLVSLPPELREQVFSHLDVHSLSALMLSCRELSKTVSESRRIWRSLCRRKEKAVPMRSDLRNPDYLSPLANLSQSLFLDMTCFDEKLFLAKCLDLKRSLRQGRNHIWRLHRRLERIERISPPPPPPPNQELPEEEGGGRAISSRLQISEIQLF
jgi:hypothetical protein